ncbi:unnamed protein product, partial [Prorocentrum cordatum]
ATASEWKRLRSVVRDTHLENRIGMILIDSPRIDKTALSSAQVLAKVAKPDLVSMLRVH